MKELKKYKSLISIFIAVILVATGVVGCNSKEAQIDDEPDVIESSVPYETLAVSNADKFGYSDLIVNKVKFGMTEEEVINIMGKPANIYDSQEIMQNPTVSTTTKTNGAEVTTSAEMPTTVAQGKDTSDLLNEKIYGYNDLSLIFMPIEGEYKLCAAASTSDTDVFARGLKVGDSKDKVIEMFYRDIDCFNHNLMSDDKSAILGKFLYGSYTIDKLETVKTQDTIEYGVINYNGNSKLEDVECIIEYTYFEPPYMSGIATVDDDFAQISFDINDENMIAGIRWYYYPEINEDNK